MSGHASSPAADKLCWALLAVFTLCLLLVSRSYQIVDRHPPTFDDAWYLESSLHFYHQLTSGGILSLISAYAGSFRTKAPLIALLPLPSYLLLGARLQSAILINFVFVIITNIYLFLLGRQLFSPLAGLAAAVFFQTMPLAYGLSRVFMPDYGLAALVVVWMYYLAVSEGLTRGSANFALGVVLGLGLLMKVLFPIYVAGPLLAALLWRRKAVRQPAQESFWLWRLCGRRPLLAMAIPSVLLASTWYAFHLIDVVRYAWQAGYGDIGQQYGESGFLAWLVRCLNEGIASYYAIALVVLGTAALVFKRRGGVGQNPVRGYRASLIAGWLILPLVLIGSGKNREIRFILPMLPAFALILAASVTALARRAAAQAMLAALVAVFPLRLYAALSSHSSVPHHHGYEHPTKMGPLILFSRDLGWARPPDAEGQWDQQRILEALREMGPPSLSARYVVVGVEHRFLNANLLQYLNGYTEYPLLFHPLGYAETSVDRAIEQIYSLDARFIVMGEGFHNYELVETFNRVNRPLQERLDRGDLPFQLLAKVALTDRINALIYKRETPWKSFLPGLPGEIPQHPLQADFVGGVRFLGYDWKRLTPSLAQFSYFMQAAHHVTQDYRVNVDFRRNGRTVLMQDHLVAEGRHPFYEWQPGEVVKQTMTVYWPEAAGTQGECRFWLARWGMGPPEQITYPKEMIHESVIPMRLEE